MHEPAAMDGPPVMKSLLQPSEDNISEMAYNGLTTKGAATGDRPR